MLVWNDQLEVASSMVSTVKISYYHKMKRHFSELKKNYKKSEIGIDNLKLGVVTSHKNHCHII